MSRRIDIEITSLQGDVATWRAAGAKLPKGVLPTSLVPGGPVVGGVYRADVEQYMEGIEVLSVAAPKTASPVDPRNERLELIPTPAKGPDVVVTYAAKGRGPRRDGDRHEGGRESSKRPGSRTPAKDRPTRERTGPTTSGPTERGPRPERPARTERGPRPERGPRTERPARPGRPGARGERPTGSAQPPMTTTHRNALLATLSPEQLPVAEQLLRGGMPAVRTAVAEQNKNATAQGRPTVDPATIDRIAEELLGRTTLALWKDRASGAIGAGKELRLRDLRAVVTSAKTVSLDEDSRLQLKETPGRPDGPPGDAAHAVEREARQGHRVEERPRGVAPRGPSARHVDARERRDRGEGGGAHVRGSHRRAGPLTLARRSSHSLSTPPSGVT